jgi:hypothetical protein
LPSCAAPVREYSGAELVQRFEVGLKGRSRDQIYIRSIEWLAGESGLRGLISMYRSRVDGKLVYHAAVAQDISPLHNLEVKFAIDMTVRKGSASLAFSSPRLTRGGPLIVGADADINMPEEMEAWKALSSRLADEYKTYVLSRPVEKQFESVGRRYYAEED